MDELKSVVVTGWASIAPGESGNIIENFKLEDYLESQKTYLDRCSALALAGTAQALRHAGYVWPADEELAHRFGITLGTHWGCVETMKGFWDKVVEKGARVANPLLFSHSYFNSPISLCAIEYGLKGYHATFCAGGNSGLEAVRAAYDAIRLCHADAMLCGGVDAVMPTRQLLESGEPIAEASVFFVIEEAERATERGAKLSVPLSDELLNSVEPAETSKNYGGATSAVSLFRELSEGMKPCA